jgi:hypothetical protein
MAAALYEAGVGVDHLGTDEWSFGGSLALAFLAT